MGTISGMTHIKMIFSFWTGIGRNFIGNGLCSCDDSVVQLICILCFFTIRSVFSTSPEKSPEVSHLENKEAREWALLFSSNDQDIPFPERHKHDRRFEVLMWWDTIWHGGPCCSKTLLVSFENLSQHITYP
jgi:hypothetical protein